MSVIGRKGRKVKPISSFLKELGDLKVIENRIGLNNLDDVTDTYVPVLLRYFEEKGVNFCQDHEILELARESETIKGFLFEKEWKHQAMMEDLLNFLTSRGVFKKKGREYQSVILSRREKQIPRTENEDISTPTRDLADHPKDVATLRDISPFGSSQKEKMKTNATQTEQQFGLQPRDKIWIEEAKPYKVVFNLFDRILSRFVLDSMRTGTKPATFDDRTDQLGRLMDSFFMTPNFVIPRMAVIIAAFKQAMPAKIFDLNCGTGRCIEEMLLFKPYTEIIGVTDNEFQLRIAERNLAVFSDQRQLNPHVEWRVVDYSHPLPSQLEDLVGQYDMVLVNQLFQFCPHDAHRRLVEEILSFVKMGGVVAFFQHLRAEKDLPWPHEWLYRAIQGFSGIPDEATFINLLKREGGKNVQEIIPLAAYLVY
ncbi:MAG: class I SAM-dependent methyltransferase [Candidatus Hodarchaeota archaeon]